MSGSSSPAGLTVGFSPATVTPSSSTDAWSEVAITAPDVAQSYTLTLQAANGGDTKTVTFPVRVTTTGISPKTLEVNLAGVRIGDYTGYNTYSEVPNCPTTWTHQECYQKIIHTLWLQGVTGVRFLFALGKGSGIGDGAFNYDPRDPAHVNDSSIKGTWSSNLGQFFQDLYNGGIWNITPTPVMEDKWGGVTVKPGCDPSTLAGGVTDAHQTGLDQQHWLQFFPWLPYGVNFEYYCEIPAHPRDPNDPHTIYCPDPLDGNWTPSDSPKGPQRDRADGNADGLRQNDAYNMANSNPYFWGWDKFYNLVDSVLQTAQSHGLTVTELDLQNEVDLVNRTVEGRLLVDNMHGSVSGMEDVLYHVGWLMDHYFHGSSFDAVTVSFGLSEPVHPRTGTPDRQTYDCVSLYGDWATLMNASALFQAIGGGSFGVPVGIDDSYGLYCGGAWSSSMPPASLPFWVQHPNGVGHSFAKLLRGTRLLSHSNYVHEYGCAEPGVL